MENAGINSDISTESIHFTQNMETTIKIREEYKEEIDELRQHLDQEALVEKALQKLKEKRKGAKVFCICCGASKRSPLRMWRNVYICSDCWKIKERIGEDQFEKALRGISE